MLLKKSWLALGLLAAMVMAEESSDLKISGWGYTSFGKVVGGYNQFPQDFDVDFSKMWLTDVNAGIKVEKKLGENYKGRLHVGFGTGFQVNDQDNPSVEFLQRKFAAYLIDVAIERTIMVAEKNSLLLEFGYLPVKYNPQAYDLGEYLFRCTPYPTTIVNGFELADKEKVAGFHVGYKMSLGGTSALKIDNYLFSEIKMYPIGDISDALLLSLNAGQIFDFGLGMDFYRAISVDKRQTNPGKYGPRFRVTQFEKFGWADPDTNRSKDTTWYTYSGTKAMGRMTFNPKGFFDSDLFGPEDLKLYAELAILGTKNYPGWYNKLSERIPLMFGFNFPTFKLLDVLSLQFQYFKNPYRNSFEYVNKEHSPVPYPGSRTQITPEDWFKDSTLTKNLNLDDWKWSLYMSRKINSRVRLSLQFASDNLTKTMYMPSPPTASKYTDICQRTWATNAKGKPLFGQIYDWYWMARIMFYF